MKKDLLVLTADADAEAVMNSVLLRCQSIGIRSISFDIRRHPNRDSGVFTGGAEFSRLLKDKYNHLIVLFDHHGSGCNKTHKACTEDLQKRLDQVSWSDCSFTAVLVPELEEWLWHNHASICTFFNIKQDDLDSVILEYCSRYDHPHPKGAAKSAPKELLDHVTLKILRKKHLIPREFKKIADQASLRQWQRSASFKQMVTALQSWFPSQV